MSVPKVLDGQDRIEHGQPASIWIVGSDAQAGDKQNKEREEQHRVQRNGTMVRPWPPAECHPQPLYPAIAFARSTPKSSAQNPSPRSLLFHKCAISKTSS